MNSVPAPPIRIGVLSDTHLADSDEARVFLLDLLENVLAPVDMLLHAGDLVAPELLDVFAAYPLHAVRGNMDPAIPGIPLKKTIDVAGFTIGMIHGWGPPDRIEDRVFAEFASTPVDCLVYGHSHQPACQRRDGILFFNPGSATDRRGMAYHSVGILEIDNEIRGTIIRID
ncbi:MAG: metallophosphoesterase family protein [Desulfuromonadales bacterium]